VRTLVVSDLHIGSQKGADLLRRPALRAPLLDALRDADRLVILGDGVELRDRPKRDVAELAAPVFADIGEALGPDGELVLTGGNHDHGLVAGWIDARLETEASGFLGLEAAIEPEAAGPLARTLAAHARPAQTRIAYPGVWLRDDVYAIHGHYLDVHTTVPTFERLAAGAMARFVVRLPEHGAAPDDYEAVLAPLYAWMNALTQRSDRAVLSAGAGASARAWVALAGGARHRRPLRTAALGAGYVTAVAALNKIGLGPIDRNLSGSALRLGSLRGMREVIARLGIPAPYVIFGHSHRSGPWESDDPAEWATPAGRMLNTGSWVYQRHFLSDEPNASPYWPGSAVLIEDDAPPRLIRLLGDRGHAELAPPRG
jgi:UDP-2,3-diacylglucosamine pyrophosphatase LpxH